MASKATQEREQQDRRGRPSGATALTEGRVTDVTTFLRDYARENPESAALWCFGIGFVMGWKLKPW
jgi:hypothetical protein